MPHTYNLKKGLCLSKLLLFFIITLSVQTNAQTITNLSGFYRSGQVFLTWDKISNSAAFYKVYRSTSPISSSADLATSEYLGYTNSTSAIDHNLTNHDGIAQYLHIDSDGAPLDPSTGLFVATTLANGDYFYAVTILIGVTENTSVVADDNSLSGSISETVAAPIPVFQSQRVIAGDPIDIYTIFTSSKFATDQPPYLNAGFLGSDFALNRNNATTNKPIKFFFHGGGADFFTNIQVTDEDEMRLNLEDYYPDSTILSNWWGANPAFDVYNMDNNTVAPTTGINHNFIQQRISYIIDWAIHHLPIDSNRIYFSAISAGSAGAYFYAINNPDRIAAVSLQVGLFNIAFQNDWQATCPLNTGNSNRMDIDVRLGTVATNLMNNLGTPTYDALNGGLVIHQFPTKDYPLIYSLNGKQDMETGWTEKTIYYDSVNANHLGGYYFWDNRGHSGGAGITWSGNNFDLYRYHRNSSYPAFAFCNLNEDDGNGNGNTGVDHGTVNGALDWNDTITDNSQTWQIKVFVRDLNTIQMGMVDYPDSATADITPRRLQNFSPFVGEGIVWNVKHNGQTIQSGSFTYNGGLIIIPQAKIFRDTSIVTISLAPCSISIDGDVSNITCHGSENGSINVTVTGAQGTISYLWSNGATTQNLTDLIAGTYTVTATDEANCSVNFEGTIMEPDKLIIHGDVNNVTCHGSGNGSIGITLTGAQGDVNYLWNDGTTTQNLIDLGAGTYTVIATDSAICTDSFTATITEPDSLIINETQVNVSSNGGNDGSINITVTGGTEAYSYLWSDGATSEDRSGLSAATYSVTVTDAHACTAFDSIVITQPQCQCIPPTSFSGDSISPSEAQVCWDAIPCAQGYLLGWRTVPATKWIYTTILAPEHCRIFTNHYPDVYEVIVATLCQNGDTSAFSSIYTFATYPSLLPPTNLYTNSITKSKAAMHWNAVSDPSNYVVYYRKTGVTKWTQKTILATKTAFTAKNLTAGTTYEWKVQSKYVGLTRTISGSYSSIISFSTLAQRIDETLSAPFITKVNVYPNPTAGQFTLEFDGNETGTFKIEVANMLGQVVYTRNISMDGSSSTCAVQLPADIANGVYFVRLIMNDAIYSEKVMVLR